MVFIQFFWLWDLSHVISFTLGHNRLNFSTKICKIINLLLYIKFSGLAIYLGSVIVLLLASPWDREFY